MDDYRWSDFESREFGYRYPLNLTWLVGAAEWMVNFRQFPFSSPADGYRWLNDIRRMSATRVTTQCPRVFVSHRQIDDKAALRIAWLAWREGFDYWLDIVDLDPQRNQQVRVLEQTLGRSLTKLEKAILTAATIEMALLNCTHVLAVMTAHTAGSQWVPYEYGRVKQVAPTTLESACWRDHTTLKKRELPEYLHLNPILDDEAEIRSWLKTQIGLSPDYSRHIGIKSDGRSPNRWNRV
jgi:hypothetical protein